MSMLYTVLHLLLTTGGITSALTCKGCKSMEVTPELSDGYEGVVRKLVCLDCQKPFYIAKDADERIHPQYCHACSLQRIGVERRRTKKPVPKEALEQAEQAIQHAQAEDVKIEDMSPEDKMVLYAALQEIADELRRIHRERRKQQRLQESQSIDRPVNTAVQGAREA
jgi:hypothetical protein